MDDGGIRAVPLRESGIVASWGAPKRGTGDSLEESVPHFLETQLVLALDVDNENGCDCLIPRKINTTTAVDVKRKNTHED